MTTRMVARLPMPNHKMNNGTQASEGIGSNALSTGRSVGSSAQERANSPPRGTAIANETPRPMTTRASRARAFLTNVPSASMDQMTRPTDSMGGVMAVEYMPLRAKPSQTAS